MKIIFLEAVQNYGGARKSTVELAVRLKDNGHEILLVDFWGSCKPFLNAVENNQLDYKILDKREEPFLLASPSYVKKVKNYLQYVFLWVNYRKKIKNIIKEFSPDLIIVNNTKTLSILPKLSKGKIGYFARGWFLPRTISFLNKIIIKRNVNIFIGVSHATRAAIFAGGGSKLKNIYVVQNAIDLKPVENIKSNNSYVNWDQSENRPINLFHCGGFLPSKGQDVMINIAKELRNRKIDFKIKLAGIVYKGDKSEKFLNNLKTEIENEYLTKYFSFIINEPNVLKEFATIDLLIHPSATEGLPRVVMESMAFGKPVIGNPVGGMTDYILDGFNGYITNYNAISDYCDAIEKLYLDKNLYHKISLNAENLIKNSFNEESQLNQFNKLLNNIS